MATDRVNDAFFDRVAVTGTTDEAQAGLATIREMGVDLLIVRAPAGVKDDAVRQVLKTFAPDRSTGEHTT